MRRAAGLGSRVDTALLAVCIVLALILKASTESVREGLASVLRSTVLAPLFSMQATTEKWRAALNTFDDMVASRDSALLMALEVPALKAENARLEKLMLLGDKLRWGWIPARVLHDASPGLDKDVTLAAGSDAGVKVLSPVITEAGLAGIVHSVDKNTSLVRLWPHREFAVGAMSEDGRAFGIIQPHRAVGSDGYLLELRNVQHRDLPIGTRVVTAGVGGEHGVYPPMIPIGVVVDTLDPGNGWARTYLVRPAVRPQELAAVIVLDPARAREGMKGVWLTKAQTDSAVRIMMIKADSMGLVKYRQELKAMTDSSLARIKAAGVRDTTGGNRSGVIPPEENYFQ